MQTEDLNLPSSVSGSKHPQGRKWHLVKEWGKVLTIALFGALFIRSFVLEAFQIPSPSMERTLMTGDYILVSKLHFGPRTPATLGIPLTSWYAQNTHLPVFRIPGFSSVKRGDVVVFNYPVDDKPLDRKTFFVKRLVALPGDTIEVDRKILRVNHETSKVQVGIQHRWVAQIKPDTIVPLEKLHALNISQLNTHHSGMFYWESSVSEADTIASRDEVISVRPFLYGEDGKENGTIFPGNQQYDRDHYGPIRVPAKGDTLYLSAETWPEYRSLITRYEHNNAHLSDVNCVEIEDECSSFYVVKKNYYFAMGDNRDDSEDSRFWGFVPEDHLVGKAFLVYFSVNPVDGKIRWDRVLTAIN